jgi:hypothetical protein
MARASRRADRGGDEGRIEQADPDLPRRKREAQPTAAARRKPLGKGIRPVAQLRNCRLDTLPGFRGDGTLAA